MQKEVEFFDTQMEGFKKQKISHDGFDSDDDFQDFDDLPHSDDEEENTEQLAGNIAIFISDFANTQQNNSFAASRPAQSQFWNRTDCKVLLTLVFQHLDLPSVTSCSLVNKLWKASSDDLSVWHVLYLRFFGENANNSIAWKTNFKNKFQYFRQVCMFGGNPLRYLVNRRLMTEVTDRLCF